MIGIPLGLAFSNVFEWGFHKYVLHGLGKNKRSFWSFHFHDHHREARRHDMVDEGYQTSVFQWNPQGKEALALTAGALAVTPLLPVAPFFVGTVWRCQWNYYKVHKRAHLDPDWAREHLPWHVAHHMGRDQDQNWCVTRPWFDVVMKTAVAMPGQKPWDRWGKSAGEAPATPPGELEGRRASRLALRGQRVGRELRDRLRRI